jgi:hypothetical protein
VSNLLAVAAKPNPLAAILGGTLCGTRFLPRRLSFTVPLVLTHTSQGSWNLAFGLCCATKTCCAQVRNYLYRKSFNDIHPQSDIPACKGQSIVSLLRLDNIGSDASANLTDLGVLILRPDCTLCQSLFQKKKKILARKQHTCSL